MKHLDDNVLSEYVLDGTGSPEVEKHLDECEICRDGAAVFREIDHALRGSETWTTVDASRNGGNRLDEILGYRKRKEDEERQARTFLARIGNSPLKFRNAAVDIAEKPRHHTEGMVRVLCAEANALHEQRPKLSEQMAGVAYTVATKLTNVPDRAKRALMGMALREHANALRYLGRFKDALKLLDYAEKLFDGTPGADPFDQAIVLLIRATVYMKSERLEEGSALARQVASVFRDYGDVSRELSAVMVDACCLLLAGNARLSADSFERAITICRLNGDRGMLARALSNCAAALKDLQDFDRAERYYVEAVTIYDELDLATEKARTEWVLAMILLARGELAESTRRLASIRKDLAKLGLTNDAALATLMWAEGRLALNEPSGVTEACRSLLVVFGDEELQRHARRALADLNEALAKGRGTATLVHEVRIYLENLTTQPLGLPAPPPQ